MSLDTGQGHNKNCTDTSVCLAVSVLDEQIARKFAQYFLEDTIRLGIDLGQAINKCTGQSEHFYLEESDVTSKLLFIHD